MSLLLTRFVHCDYTGKKTYFLNSRGSLKSTLSMKPSSNSSRPKNNKKVVNNSAHVQFNPIINLGLGQIADMK